MNRLVLVFGTCLLLVGAAIGQAPDGASKFIRDLGGLDLGEGRPDIIQQIAGSNLASIEGGDGIYDWTEVKGRVFLTRSWMVEIDEIKEGYSTFDFEKILAESMQKQLESEGFKLTPGKFNLHSIRYQRGSTVGTLNVRTFWLGKGNPPLRMEFIFHESYLRKTLRKRTRSSN